MIHQYGLESSMKSKPGFMLEAEYQLKNHRAIGVLFSLSNRFEGTGFSYEPPCQDVDPGWRQTCLDYHRIFGRPSTRSTSFIHNNFAIHPFYTIYNQSQAFQFRIGPSLHISDYRITSRMEDSPKNISIHPGAFVGGSFAFLNREKNISQNNGKIIF